MAKIKKSKADPIVTTKTINTTTKNKRKSSSIKTTQTDFFLIDRQIWANVSDNLTDIAKKKPSYTAKFVSENIAKIEAVENMPEAVANNQLSKIYREELTMLADQATYQWDLLSMYIEGAFTNRAEQEANLVSAGLRHRPNAKQLKWGSVTSLMKAGRLYLTANTAKLSANNNMPDAFPDEYKAADTAFNDRLTMFINEKSKKDTPTTARQDAINDLYKIVQGVCKDCQRIFANDLEKIKLFTYDEVKKKLLGTKPGGAKGRLVDENGRPIGNVLVTANGSRVITTISGKNGRFSMLQMAAGKYRFVFTLEGYEPVTVEHEVEAGIVGRFKGDVVMRRVVND